MKTVGLLTSGGDSPGMNAAIRAFTRYAIDNNFRVIGFLKGLKGVLDNEYIELNDRSVSGIIERGGTILQSSREPRFLDPNYRKLAYSNLNNLNIDTLVIIGGNGSFNAAYKIYKESNIKVICITGTIDNDIYPTEYTLGYDTALNTAKDAIDKIRDTAYSFERVFIVEVMGRDYGQLPLEVALATGSEIVLVPEFKVDIEKIAYKIHFFKQKGKKHVIIVLSEGYCGAFEFYNQLNPVLKKYNDYELKVSVLGHIQRGGSPTAKDRIFGTLSAYKAVDAIIKNQNGYYVGLINNKYDLIPLEEAVNNKKKIEKDLVRFLEEIAV
ncbi:MAG: ATP-dependent 6-phosphofructokinase [bacterium]|jgi:6-phosphofructokinase 1